MPEGISKQRNDFERPDDPATVALARLEERILQLDRLTEAKFVTLRTLMDSQAEKVALALNASDKAVTKAEVATEKRFESVNEFRGQLDDQAKQLVTRVEFNALRDSIVDKVDEIRRHADRDQGRGAGLQQGWGYLVALISVAIAIVSVILAFNT